MKLTASIFGAEQTGAAQMKAERRQLVWRFLFSLGAIGGTVALATLIAHSIAPMP